MKRPRHSAPRRLPADGNPPAALWLRTLGDPALYRRNADGTSSALIEPSKLLALIVYITFSPGRTATRDGLVDLLWSDLEPDAGRHALRQHLWQLRRRIGSDLVVEGRDQLTLTSPIDSDRAQFVAAGERSEFKLALDLYTGDFFPGFAASGAGEFERWAENERADLRSRFVRCGEMVIKELLNTHHAREAVLVARRVRAVEPMRQHGWRLLLESLLASGDALSAAVECESLERMAAEEEMALELFTRSLMATVRRSGIARTSGESRGPLQVELVGREREFATLVEAWERARRRTSLLLRIEGPPGFGKTRLLAEFQTRLDSMQARSVLVRGNSGSSSVAFSLASDLAEKLGLLPGARAVSPHSLRILVALAPSLSSTFETVPHVSSAADLPRHRLSAMRELVAAIAAERPLAILVDDLHWADHASRTLLAALRGSLWDDPVLLCVTTRETATDLSTSGSSTAVLLGPLGESAILSLLSSVASLPSEPWADRLVSTLHRLSQGVPLYIIEALQLALQEGLLEIRDGLWATADAGRLWHLFDSGEVLLRRISVLDPYELRLLRTLASAAHPLAEDVVLSAGSDSPSSGSAALSGLIHRGLVQVVDGQVRIAHDEMGARVLEGTPDPDKALIRRRLGTVLAQGDDTDPQRQRFAAAQFRATGSAKELSVLFGRYVYAARRREDNRPVRMLARELLGDSAPDPEVHVLARSLSVETRIRAFGLTRAAAIAGIAFGIVGSVIGLTSIARDNSELVPEFAIQADVLDSTGTYRTFEIDLPDDISNSDEPIVIGGDEPVFTTDGVRSWQLTAQPGSPNRWATVRDVGDSGVTDIFVLEPGRAEHRLTFTPGDDVNPEWSPDGNWIAFSTSRWDSLGHTDLAIMTRAGAHVRRLTGGHSSDVDPKWSPDGSRIAFIRRHFSRQLIEVCVITFNGSRVVCGSQMGHRAVAWLNDSLLAVQAGDPKGATVTEILSVRPDTLLSVRRVAIDAAAIANNGSWWIGTCTRTLPPRQFCLTSDDDPPRSHPVRAARGEIVSIDFVRRRASGFVEALAVRNRHAVARTGVPFVLDVVALRSGRMFSDIPALSVRSLDTLVARLDHAGRVIGSRAGVARLELTAGGWRTDTIGLTIAPAEKRELLREEWTSMTANWHPFGEPPPRLSEGESGARALEVAGDGVYHSGVYASLVPPTAGITIRTRIATPINQRQWQYLAVALLARKVAGPLPEWNSSSGYIWSGGGFREVCALYVPPPSEGENAKDSLMLTGSGHGVFPAPRVVPSGEWYSVVLQLFPDGRCGVAVDGEPVAMTGPNALPTDLLYVSFFGNSVGTRLLVGETTASIGVASDINWESRPR